MASTTKKTAFNKSTKTKRTLRAPFKINAVMIEDVQRVLHNAARHKHICGILERDLLLHDCRAGMPDHRKQKWSYKKEFKKDSLWFFDRYTGTFLHMLKHLTKKPIKDIDIYERDNVAGWLLYMADTVEKCNFHLYNLQQFAQLSAFHVPDSEGENSEITRTRQIYTVVGEIAEMLLHWRMFLSKYERSKQVQIDQKATPGSTGKWVIIPVGEWLDHFNGQVLMFTMKDGSERVASVSGHGDIDPHSVTEQNIDISKYCSELNSVETERLFVEDIESICRYVPHSGGISKE